MANRSVGQRRGTKALWYLRRYKSGWDEKYGALRPRGSVGQFDRHPMVEKIRADFPGPKCVGEWVQIRDRRGRPIQKLVALPVKDLLHIERSLLLITQHIETLADVHK